MKIKNILKSNDGISLKYIQETGDGYYIETTYVDYPNKHIICYSTQIGCSQRCQMCYNGISNNFKRNLRSREIIDQIQNVVNDLKLYTDTKKDILFSAMGIGEPLANYANYVNSLYKLHLIYPKAKFAVSTSGNYAFRIIDLFKYVMNRNAEDENQIKLKLMISIHSADKSIRKRLMPRSENIDIITYIMSEHELLRNNPVQIEYNIVLIDGINDTDDDAVKLYKLFKVNNIEDRAHIKINKFNKVSNCKFEPSKRVEEFIRTLKSLGIKNVEYYETNASDISGACGQMSDNPNI